MKELLLATADASLSQSLRREFEAVGFAVRARDRVQNLLEELHGNPAHVFVLDLDIAPEPPFELLGALRADPRTARLAVVALSQRRTSPRDVIFGLRMGATEYVAAPFDPRVVASRIQALLQAIDRRKPPSSVLSVCGGELQMDIEAHRLSARNGERLEEIPLSPKEFLLLERLLAQKNRLVTKEELMRALWPSDPARPDNVTTLAQFIAHLRRKLGAFGKRVRTVWSLGYRFDEA